MRTLIIAEAGLNHNGDIRKALDMVDVAKWAGADVVKFQTFRHFPDLKKYELLRPDHEMLMDRCKELDIEFLSSAFDLESLDLLHELGLTRWKIPSGQITDLPYLRKVASFEGDVLLSMGASTTDEVERALRVLFGSRHIIMMKCVSEYPAAYAPLSRAGSLGYFGYSDHTLGIAFPIAAVAIGAVAIEKHFDMAPSGLDADVSLSPDELREMCQGIRFVEACKKTKGPTVQEMENRKHFRTSIVAARRIAKGEPFSNDNLTTRRPGTGRSPMDWDRMIGLPALRDYEEGEQI